MAIKEISLSVLEDFANWCVECHPDNPAIKEVLNGYDDENDLFLGGDPELHNEDAHQCGSRVGSALLKECPELFDEFWAERQETFGEIREAKLPSGLKLELEQLGEEIEMEKKRREWEWSF